MVFWIGPFWVGWGPIIDITIMSKSCSPAFSVASDPSELPYATEYPSPHPTDGNLMAAAEIRIRCRQTATGKRPRRRVRAFRDGMKPAQFHLEFHIYIENKTTTFCILCRSHHTHTRSEAEDPFPNLPSSSHTRVLAFSPSRPSSASSASLLLPSPQTFFKTLYFSSLLLLLLLPLLLLLSAHVLPFPFSLFLSLAFTRLFYFILFCFVSLHRRLSH